MIFSIIMMLTEKLTTTSTISPHARALPSRPHHRRRRNLLFTGASIQAVSTGAYRAVEFIKKNIKLENTEKASVNDSKKVVEICTKYAQKGMFNIFLTVFFSTLAFACVEPTSHRLLDLHRALRPVPSHLHGQRRRRLGQCQEGC